MLKASHNLSESDLRTAWQWTVGICLSYVALLIILIGFVSYDLTFVVSVPHKDQARFVSASEPSGSEQLAAVDTAR